MLSFPVSGHSRAQELKRRKRRPLRLARPPPGSSVSLSSRTSSQPPRCPSLRGFSSSLCLSLSLSLKQACWQCILLPVLLLRQFDCHFALSSGGCLCWICNSRELAVCVCVCVCVFSLLRFCSTGFWSLWLEKPTVILIIFPYMFSYFSLALKHSVQFSRSVVSNYLRPHGPQHARPPCPSPTPGAHSNSCPSSW